MSSTPPDPAAFFRTMLGEWEKIANGVGGQVLKSADFARTMQGASGAALNAQEAMKGVMERALAAANMPSRTELEDLSARLARIEAAMFRLEGKIDALGAAPASMTSDATGSADAPAGSAASRPSRNRRPPAADPA